MTHSLRWIVPSVIAFHLATLIVLQAFYNEWVPVKQKKIAVRTIQLSPRKEVIAARESRPVAPSKPVTPEIGASSPPPRKEVIAAREPRPVAPSKPVTPEIGASSPPAPSVQSVPAKEKKPPAVKQSKEMAKPKPVVKKSKPAQEVVPDRKQELVALAKEKIGKIAASSDKILKSSFEGISSPKAIEEVSFSDVGGDFTVKELAYRDELVLRLKLYLKLPEYGNVKVTFKVLRSGKIEHLKILSFQSTRNAEYIEKHLPKLEMPAFKDAESYDFTIVMSNE